MSDDVPVEEDPNPFIDATRPHSKFRYPPFPKSEGPPELWLEEFRRLAWKAAPSLVRVLPNLEAATRSWIKNQNLSGKSLAMSHPAPSEFLAAAKAENCSVIWIDRDQLNPFEGPEFTRAAGFLLSQPNRADGFYYPDEMYLEMLEKLRARSQAPVLCEESQRLFTLNEVAPGSAESVTRKIERLFVAQALNPVYSPHGPSLAWWYPLSRDPAMADTHAAPLDAEALLEGIRALRTFQARQGSAFAEFQRKILLLEKGLRMFGDALKPALNSKRLTIPVWPESGFHLLLNIGPLLKLRGQTSREYVQYLEENHKIRLLPGEDFGMPESLGLCFAGTPKWLENLGRRLAAAFTED